MTDGIHTAVRLMAELLKRYLSIEVASVCPVDLIFVSYIKRNTEMNECSTHLEACYDMCCCEPFGETKGLDRLT